MSASLLAALGGLILAGATAADWLVAEDVRTVGGVPLRETVGTSGTVFAGGALVAGIAVVLLALLALAVRSRWLGLGLLLSGVFGLGAVAAGLLRTLSTGDGQGTVTPWPALAVAAGGLVVTAGWLAWRRPPKARVLGARYTVDEVDEDDEDAEWRRAGGDEEPS